MMFDDTHIDMVPHVETCVPPNNVSEHYYHLA